MNGLTLSRLFYESAARPIIESVVSPEQYSAALIGWSSEVLGYDDAHSRDHNWGPRFILFLAPEVYENRAEIIDRRLSEQLPLTFLGYPANFGPTRLGDQRVMQQSETGPVNHFIQIETIDHYLRWFLGIDSGIELNVEKWLEMPEHNLLGFTSGEVFHDGLGQLTNWRVKLRYYPSEAWYRLLIRQWRMIATEESFVARCAERGDIVGSLLITARIVECLMRLCFLMEQRYAPYAKWFGTAFQQLSYARELGPVLEAAIQGLTVKEREEALEMAYVIVARLHNKSGITKVLPEEVSPAYEGRPGRVIHAGHFANAIEALLNDSDTR